MQSPRKGTRIKAKPRQKSIARRSRAFVAENVRSLDSFGQIAPQFNIKGKSHATTSFGGLLTLVIMVIAFIYEVEKLIVLLEHSNTTITKAIEDSFYSQQNLDLRDIQFHAAFTFEGVKDSRRKDDPRYVKVFAIAV